MTPAYPIVFCSSLHGEFGFMDSITSRLKGFVTVISLILNLRTKQKPIHPSFLFPLVTTGEVNNRVCLSPTGRALYARLLQFFVVTCLLALSGATEIVGAAGPVSRYTFSTTDGVTLSVLEAGKEHASDGKLTIACIPGWSMPGSIWQRQLEEIGLRYHTVALDPRGQGQSEVPSFGYTAERRATDLHEFLQPFSHVLLIGWSLGAIEALQYVEMFGTQRLAGLVLVDSSVGEEPAPL